jgi:hypothetical protein
LLQASNSLNYRLWNLYSNAGAGWLNADGDYKHAGYYLLSFVHRFLAVFSLIRQFESEALFVDVRIAERMDFIFLNYLAAIRWVMTDVALFDGVAYDTFRQRDHFFADNLRQYCDACVSGGQFITYDGLGSRVAADRSLDPVFRFFDSLCPSEDRLRWDRLVAFHLLLMAFVNSFGYEPDHTSQAKFNAAARHLRHQEILANLVAWLPRHGLGKDKESRRVIRACRALKQMRSSARLSLV